MGKVRRALTERAEVTALAVLVLVVVGGSGLFSSRSIPFAIYVVGLIGGATIALHAVGLVLVYRSNRIINFAQLQMGAVAGALFLRLVDHRVFVRGIRAVCSPCIPPPRTVGDILRLPNGATGIPPEVAARFRGVRLSDPRVAGAFPQGLSRHELAIGTAPGWAVQLNFWLSAVVSIAVAILLVWLLYLLIINRFNGAPRLVLTVITIAAGSFAGVVAKVVLGYLFNDSNAGDSRFGRSWGVRVPIDIRIHLNPAVISAVDLLAVAFALAAALGLALYFRRARAGIVLRGAAENPQRAQTLGVNLNAVTSRAWLIAGALSGVAAVLSAAKTGAQPLNDYGELVRTMTAAVVGGMVGLPLTIAGAFSVGLIDQTVLRATGSQGWVTGLLLTLIVVLLLAQHRRASRAEVESQAAWLASRELRRIPDELRDLPAVRRVTRLLVVIGVFVVGGYPWFMSPSQTNLAAVTMIYAIIGLSLLILTGWAGQISLAQVAFAAIGAWITAVSGLPFLLAVPAGALVGALAAVVVGIPALRLRGLYLAVSTLALSLAVSSILLDPRLLGRALPSKLPRPLLLGIDFDDDRSFYYLTLVFLAAGVVSTMGLRRSRTARALIASKDNERAAQSFGINLVRARLGAFAISGFMAALAGSLFAYSQRGVDTGSFSPSVSVDLFLMVLLGGLGSVAGPILGAVYLGLLHILSGGALGQITDVLLSPGAGVILVLLFLPGGLSQLAYVLRDAWLRRLAVRYRIDVPSLVPVSEGITGLPIRPNQLTDGRPVEVPRRYRLDEQWGVDRLQKESTGA